MLLSVTEVIKDIQALLNLFFLFKILISLLYQKLQEL